MNVRNIYKKIKAEKYLLRVSYDKRSKGRPAWIQIKGLPKGVTFISVHLGKMGREGRRIQFYKTYLPSGLFLPLDYTKEEMQEYYNKFAETYDQDIRKHEQNIRAAHFLLRNLKKYIQKGKILDLGAGTGLITGIFVKAGFFPATLVDYSQGMLNRAKKKKGLEGCTFIKADIRTLSLKGQFDVILSFFSFASSSYFNSEELDHILDIAHKHLKKNGVIAILGHFGADLFEKKFKTKEKGIYVLNEKSKFYTDYFIGEKK